MFDMLVVFLGVSNSLPNIKLASWVTPGAWLEGPSPPMVRARRNGKGYHGNRTEPRALKDKYSLWSWVWGLEC